MNNLKISVIVPVYNIKDELENCINSILNQTYNNLEIIIVDDGSNEETVLLIDKQKNKDSRIKVIHQNNCGVTSARICGVNNASGYYIGFVDGDDFIEPDMYERLIYNAQKYDADISHCGYKMVFKNRVDIYYGTGQLIIQNNHQGLKDLLIGDKIEPGLWNKLYKKSLLSEMISHKEMDFSIKINEDLLMNFYLFNKSKKSVFEDFCPYHYIVRKGSAVNREKNINHLVDPLKVSKIILEKTEDNKDLNLIVYKKMIRQLINISSLSKTSNDKNICMCIKNSRLQLKNIFFKEIQNKKIDLKLKIMIFISSFFPNIYIMINFIYNSFTGNNKKYEID